MAMDVVGLQPICEEGKYFRASVWAWHALVDIMQTTCSDFLPEQFFHDISYNAGHGASESESRLIANRLVQYSEHNIAGGCVSQESQTILATVSSQILAKTPALESPSFNVSDNQLQKWITFLQNSKGFKVY